MLFCGPHYRILHRQARSLQSLILQAFPIRSVIISMLLPLSGIVKSLVTATVGTNISCSVPCFVTNRKPFLRCLFKVSGTQTIKTYDGNPKCYFNQNWTAQELCWSNNRPRVLEVLIEQPSARGCWLINNNISQLLHSRTCISNIFLWLAC